MIVVDTSAFVEVLAGDGPDPALLDRLAGDGDLHAPHLVDVEYVQVLRRLVAARQLTDSRADDARAAFAALAIERYPHVALSDRMWELRHNVTAYDAAFLVLAEMLAAPLVTLDARIAGAPGSRAAVEVYGTG